jgi:ATP-binding cassette subfamily C protein LapB
MNGSTDQARGGPLLECLLVLCRYHDRELSRESALAGLPLAAGVLTPSVFPRAAQRAQLASRVVAGPLESLNAALLPTILLLQNDRACVLVGIDRSTALARVVYPELGETAVEVALDALQADYAGHAIYVRPEFRFDGRAPEIRVLKGHHWFWGVIRENRGLYRDVLIASVLINLFAVAMPLFVMNVYDRVVPNHATDTLWVLAAGILVVLVADLILRVMRSAFVDLGASRADVKLSSAIMERILGMQMVNRPASVGSFAANVQAFESVRHFIGSLTVLALVDLPFVLMFAFVIALIGWPMVIPVVIGAFLVLIYAMTAQTRLQALSENSMRASAMRNATLVESLGSLETVKALGSEGRIQASWEKATIFLARIAAQMRLLSSSISSGALWTQHTVAVAVIIVGVYLIVNGELSQGGLIAAYLLSSRAMAPISQAAGLLSQYHNSAIALQSLNDIMARPVERPEGANWISRPVLRGEVEFRDMSFRYPDQELQALAGIRLRIKAGEHVAIVGRNGSGKSTLQKLIMGFYQPQTGAVLLDGVDLRQLDPAELRRNIGYVPQEVSLFFGTLRENILAGAGMAGDRALLRAARLSGLSGFVDAHPAGFQMAVGERGQLLSGGQRQAVGIARALIHDPPLLLLDEPTASLDHQSEERILRSLRQISQGRTLILASHRGALLALVDRVIVVDGGRMVADGPKEEVLAALSKGLPVMSA